jgi:hypothetical protein
MLIVLWTSFALMVACGFIGWCCVRVGARSDMDEEEVSSACEGALIAELSDIEFTGARK